LATVAHESDCGSVCRALLANARAICANIHTSRRSRSLVARRAA